MKQIFVLVFISLIGAACGQFPGSQTAVPETVSLEPTVFSTSPFPSPTDRQLTPTAEPTPTSTSTPEPSPTPTATQTPPPTPLPRPFEISVDLSPITYPIPFAVVDDIAYIVENGRFAIWNISDATNPTELWHYQFQEDFVDGLGVIKSHVFLRADGQLKVWDVENPRIPTLVSSLSVPAGRSLFDGNGKRLYILAIPEGQITTIDLTNPVEPLELGTADLNEEITPTYNSYSTTSQNHLFLVGGETIKIFDITDPLSTSLVTQINDVKDIGSRLIIANHLIFIGAEYRILVYNIENMMAPYQVGDYAGFSTNGLNIIGNTGFSFLEICGFEPTDDGEVTGGCGKVLEIVDFSNPAQPEQEGIFRIEYQDCYCYTESVRFIENRIYFETSINLYLLNTADYPRE